jgi:S1-C subfamily serine protease
MSLGIISRAGRSYRDSASFEYIQTDAGAYPGGSGGTFAQQLWAGDRDHYHGFGAG